MAKYKSICFNNGVRGILLVTIALICTISYIANITKTCGTMVSINKNVPLSPPKQNRMKLEKLKLFHPQKFPGKFHYLHFVETPKLPSGYENNAKTGYGECIKNVPNNKVDPVQFKLLTNFVSVYKPEIRRNMLIYDSRPPSDMETKARVNEITDTLQSNLNKDFISAIHVFVNDQEEIRFLKSLDLENSQKLVIQKMEEQMSFKLYLTYASKCLMHELIAMAHQDILFGTGWDNLKLDTLINNRLLYALTRHSAFESKCLHAGKGSTTCNFDGYVGSHDVFVLYMAKKFEADTLNLMNSHSNSNGVENVFIWVLQKKLGYTVTNPCPILQAHHQHCVPMRGSGRIRVNNETTSGMAGYTNSLDPFL